MVRSLSWSSRTMTAAAPTLGLPSSWDKLEPSVNMISYPIGVARGVFTGKVRELSISIWQRVGGDNFGVEGSRRCSSFPGGGRAGVGLGVRGGGGSRPTLRASSWPVEFCKNMAFPSSFAMAMRLTISAG